MILEGLVTTCNEDGSIHIAPMGPRMLAKPERFLLRPFPSSHTCQNLIRHRQGILHTTDDVVLLAKSAVGVKPPITTFPAQKVQGGVLANACRYFEFVVHSIDDRKERVEIEAEIVHQATLRDFFGFNRAKHAVLEAAILATRLHILPTDEIVRDFTRYRIIVEKTGGPQEFEAFEFLETFVRRHHTNSSHQIAPKIGGKP